VCFGAGAWLSVLSDEFSCGIEKTYAYVVDNNPALWGTKKKVRDTVLEVCAPEKLYRTASERTIVLITVGDWPEIYDELEKVSQLKDLECHSAVLIGCLAWDRATYNAQPVPTDWRMNATAQIPKTIHYAWFGDRPIPEKFKAYMNTWKEFCPDYELIEWNNGNYDPDAHPYVRQSLACGRPGFAVDYIRCDVVYRYGGIYLDVDVELIKNLDDLLYNTAYCGFQDVKYVALGLGFGAVKNHPMIKAMRDEYDTVSILKADGTQDLTASPVFQTKTLLNRGLKPNGEFQIVNGLAIYPAVYLNPYSLNTGRDFRNENTFSIHHFEASWLTEDERSKVFRERRLRFATVGSADDSRIPSGLGDKR
jgi:hypothetical protein